METYLNNNNKRQNILYSGAVIEDGTLKDLDANAAAIATAPTCQIAFLPENCSEDKARDKIDYDLGNGVKDIVNIPVYANSQRDALICSLPVGCLTEEHDNWLRRGVAFHLKLT